MLRRVRRCADCADRRAGFDPRRVCGLCGSPRRARPSKGVRIVRIATPGSTPGGCADRADRHAGIDPRRVCGLCGSPRRARPSKGVRIVRIATPGSTPGGCADRADAAPGSTPGGCADRADRHAGLDPRRVCGSCGSPRRARPPESVRIVRIAAPGSTPGGCADCAARHAGFDPRRVCGSCGSPDRRSSHGTGRFSPSRNFPLDSPRNRSHIVPEPERDDDGIGGRSYGRAGRVPVRDI